MLALIVLAIVCLVRRSKNDAAAEGADVGLSEYFEANAAPVTTTRGVTSMTSEYASISEVKKPDQSIYNQTTYNKANTGEVLYEKLPGNSGVVYAPMPTETQVIYESTAAPLE